jgi:hypothetical protein
MTSEDIIRMAEECGIPEFENNESQADNILRFSTLVAVAEREACAKVCETKLGPTATDFYGKTYAAAIRARGKE